MTDTVAVRTRVRFRFSKLGKVRFTSHRDTARCWERALRRAELPVSYTEGFSPRPKVSFGLALSTGHESLAECLDVDLATDPAAVDVDSLPARLDPAPPPPPPRPRPAAAGGGARSTRSRTRARGRGEPLPSPAGLDGWSLAATAP